MEELFYAKIENNILIRYYQQGLDSEEECNEVIKLGGICLDFELFQYCLELGQVEFNEKVESGIYTISDKDLFKQSALEVESLLVSKTELEIKVEDLENENADLLLDSVKKDIRIEQNELDIADLLLTMGGM